MKKGSILITTLWIMAILSLLAMGIGFRASLEVRLGKYAMDKLQGRYLAKAGIVKMRQYLTEDRKTKHDTLYECGIALDEEETPEGIFGAESNKLGNGSFSIYYEAVKDSEEEVGEAGKMEKIYGLMDEERKININIKNMEVADYRNIMRRLLPEPEGEELSTKDELITAILHWQGKAGGNINHGPEEHAYEPKKDEFEFIEELLLVKGVTREIFESVRDYITVYGDGKININTASRKVLNVVIGFPELVEKVIEDRRGQDKKERTEDDGFKQAGQITFIPKDKRKHFTFKSDNFRIISHGSVGKVESMITCVIGKTAGEKEEAFKYYHEE